MSKRTYEHVLVLPSWRLGRPSADDDFSISSHVSKVFERIIYMQIDTFIRDKLSKLLTGFRKNLSMQHYLMAMLEM